MIAGMEQGARCRRDAALRHRRHANISWITAMDVRNMFNSAGSTGLATGLLAAAAGDAMSTQPATSREKMRGADYVGCPDGTKLSYTDWGVGKPVVFIHAWALPSAMWDYQRGPLSEQGLRCIAYDRRGHGRSGAPNGGDCGGHPAQRVSTTFDPLHVLRLKPGPPFFY